MSMAHDTLICVEGVAPERLSALRDASLAPDEAQRLREHVAGCAACRARLADYDTVASVLRQQRELEPGERIISGVRERLATQRAPMPRIRQLRPSRRLWASLATLAPVAALILLFVYVFGGLARGPHPATGRTPTAPAPTASNGKPNFPTTTPALVTMPSFTPSISTDAAWGTLSPVATYQTPQVANMQFTLDTLSPDATTLAGTEMNVIAPTASGIPQVYLISYDIASHTYKRLGPHWTGYAGSPWGGANALDSRYIVYGYNSQPGATCGVCHNTIWSYDRLSGASWEVNAGNGYSGALGELVSGDHVAFTSASGQMWVADLATQQVTQAIPASEPANADIRLMGFTWPYLIYSVQSSTQTGGQFSTTLKMRNMQTNSVFVYPPTLESTLASQSGPGISSGLSWVAMIGATLYFTMSTTLTGVDSAGAPVNSAYGTLFRINHIFSSGQTPEFLARWQISQADAGDTPAVNQRLIVLGSGYIWDAQEGKLVRLNPAGAVLTVGATLSGNYLRLTRVMNPNALQAGAIYQGSIYDTTTLPVR